MKMMILVDIYVPSVDKKYDFSLDPSVKVKTIIEEISEMIAHKEQTEIIGTIEELIICDKRGGRILNGADTLSSCHIRAGSELILV